MTCIITALDYARAQDATRLVAQLDPTLTRVKIGNELFTAAGPALVEHCQKQGFDVFLDLKYHDIPNTVAKAVAAAGSLGVWMVNLHAGGGLRMMLAAREALVPYSGNKGTRLIGVTVLTSLDEGDMKDLGFKANIAEVVLSRAKRAIELGCDGVISSGMEAQGLRNDLGANFLIVSPGIRPVENREEDDQNRVVTPKEALEGGADYIVMGRPVTKAPDPVVAAKNIQKEIAELFPS